MTTISNLHLPTPRAQAEPRAQAAPTTPDEADQRWVLLLATVGWLAMATIAALLLTGAWSPLDRSATGDTQQQNPAESPQNPAQIPAFGRPTIPQPRQPQPDSPQPRRTHAPQPRSPKGQ